MKPDTSAKFFFTLLIATCGFLFPWFVNGILLLILILIRFTTKSFQPDSSHHHLSFGKLLLTAAGLTVLMTVINGLLMRNGSPLLTIAGISLYVDGIEFGLTTSFRLILLMIALYLFFSSTSMPSLIEFLSNLGVPRSILLLSLLTLHWIETLQARIKQIFIAQEARGAAVRGSFVRRIYCVITLLSPLVLSSIVESLDRGVALELRGFSLENQGPRQRISFFQLLSLEARVFLSLNLFILLLWIFLWLLL
ncbi:MAG: energy-coupling factor transporter transmembrane component T [bacterium]